MPVGLSPLSAGPSSFRAAVARRANDTGQHLGAAAAKPSGVHVGWHYPIRIQECGRGCSAWKQGRAAGCRPDSLPASREASTLPAMPCMASQRSSGDLERSASTASRRRISWATLQLRGRRHTVW